MYVTEAFNVRDFEEVVPWICTRNTSANPSGWNKKCPVWSHSGVVSLLAEKLFGGKILRASLEQIPEFKLLGWHYWNLLADDEIDFSDAQFGGRHPPILIGEIVKREDLLADPDTAARYALVWQRLEPIISVHCDPRFCS